MECNVTKLGYYYKDACELSWRLVHCFVENLTEEQKQQFLAFYKRLCHIGAPKNSDTSSPSSPTSVPSSPARCFVCVHYVLICITFVHICLHICLLQHI